MKNSMEEEIQEKLEEIYNFKIEVNFVDFRQYEIIGKIEEKEFVVPVLYNSMSTLDGNIANFKNAINTKILELFKK